MRPDPGEIVLACAHVLREERSVALVVHHRDGMWQFTCGEGDHEEVDGAGGVHAGHLIARQANLRLLPNVPAGKMAESLDGAWRLLDHDD